MPSITNCKTRDSPNVPKSTRHNPELGIMYKLFSDAKFRKKVIELCRSADLWDFNTVRLYEMLR